MDIPVNKPFGPQPPKPSQPIPFDRDSNKPIPFDIGATSQPGISHAPLDLGAGSTAESPQVAMPKPAEKKIAEKVVSTNRITGIKTFFTKLHPGAMEFLDEQITAWLKQNPGITIKHTNIATGEVQAKKTEPNIIITVWY
jgi:hypothetical protein